MSCKASVATTDQALQDVLISETCLILRALSSAQDTSRLVEG